MDTPEEEVISARISYNKYYFKYFIGVNGSSQTNPLLKIEGSTSTQTQAYRFLANGWV